jgi:hypothetical protein
MLKRVLSLVICVIFMSVIVQASVAMPCEQDYTIENIDGKIVCVYLIDQEDVPDGIVPLNFDTVQEADEFIRNYTGMTAGTSCDSDDDGLTSMQSVSGDVLVAEDQIPGILTSGTVVVQLRLDYTVSARSGTRARIESANPYISKFGFPVFADWETSNIYGYQGSDGKSYFSSARGQINYYIIIDGLTRFYTVPANLSGWSYLIR